MVLKKLSALALVLISLGTPLAAQTDTREVTVTRTARDFYRMDGSSRYFEVRDCAADAVSRKAIVTRVKGTGSTPTTVTIKFFGEFYEPVCEVVRIID